MRMAASDTGVLRRICAREEQPVEAGQVLAVLTTDRDEGVGDMDETLRNAAAFRVVNNRVDAMHEEMSQ
jgi:pyruvate/2-oxoglutarate dehydrogenase complex dihydrolipoamide acyltransferase (E2) component